MTNRVAGGATQSFGLLSCGLRVANQRSSASRSSPFRRRRAPAEWEETTRGLSKGIRSYIFPPGSWHGEQRALSTGRTTLTKRSGTSVGAGAGEGTAVATAVAVGDGEGILLGEVAAQFPVCSIAATEAPRRVARSRVMEFSYGRTRPKISLSGSV